MVAKIFLEQEANCIFNPKIVIMLVYKNATLYVELAITLTSLASCNILRPEG